LEVKELYAGINTPSKNVAPVDIIGEKGGLSVRYTGQIAKGNLSIYSPLGTRLYNRPLAENSFISLPSGIYIVKATAEEGEKTVKVMVK
jgi:hypothetical protein